MVVAVCVETPTRFARRTVDNATGIAIGALLKLTTGNVAIITSGASDPFAGIAWEEKTANDGLTEITVAMNGRWIIDTSGANVTCGNIVVIAAANQVKSAAESDTVLGTCVGKSLTTLVGAGTVVVEVGEVI